MFSKLEDFAREVSQKKHGERIEARRRANRPWNSDGS